MDNYILKKLPYCLVLFLVMTGCGEMDDIQEKFTLRGETIYTAKADSLQAFGGLNRIQLSWLLISDPKIHKYKVFWNNGRDSVEQVIERSADVDTIELTLNGLEEGTYYFEVFTYDEIGNSSVTASVIGNAYGERYANSLLTRSHRKFTRVDNNIEVEWMVSDEQLVTSDLEYVDRSGNLKSIQIERTDEFTLLENFPIGGKFKIRSAFVPEPNAIDTFYTDYSTFRIPLDTLQWNNYPVLFGHKGNLIAMQEDAQLMQLDPDGNGGFKWPRRISGGWGIFDTFFSNETGVIARFPDGGLRLYGLRADGSFAPTKTIGSGFDIFDPFFAYGDDLMGRKDNGELWIYPLDANGNFGTASSITGTWDQYVQMWGSIEASAVFGLTSDGKLWNIPISGGAAGTAVEIGQNWDRFNLISSFGDDLIAREADGKLWYYPVNVDGTLGSPEEVLVVRERL